MVDFVWDFTANHRIYFIAGAAAGTGLTTIYFLVVSICINIKGNF